MTNLRETLITRIDFAVEGTELDEAAWKLRRSSLLKRLYTQLPALRNLMASSIKTTTELAGQRAVLVLYLQESAQTPLHNLSITCGNQDLYLQDLRRLREQQAALPERFEQAMRSTDHPADDPDLGELRQLIWRSRREGKIQLHSSPSGEWREIPHLPHALPSTAQTSVKAQVLRMSRTEVRIELLDDLVCPFSSHRIFSRANKINLHRHYTLCDLPNTVVLATFMHQQTSADITIEIEYSWIDGRPHRLTISAIHCT